MKQEEGRSAPLLSLLTFSRLLPSSSDLHIKDLNQVKIFY